VECAGQGLPASFGIELSGRVLGCRIGYNYRKGGQGILTLEKRWNSLNSKDIWRYSAIFLGQNG
jgi:hypothetical protein